MAKSLVSCFFDSRCRSDSLVAALTQPAYISALVFQAYTPASKRAHFAVVIGSIQVVIIKCYPT